MTALSTQKSTNGPAQPWLPQLLPGLARVTTSMGTADDHRFPQQGQVYGKGPSIPGAAPLSQLLRFET